MLHPADTCGYWHLETTNSSLCYLQRTPLRYGQHDPHIHAMHTYESLIYAFSDCARKMFLSHYFNKLCDGRFL